MPVVIRRRYFALSGAPHQAQPLVALQREVPQFPLPQPVAGGPQMRVVLPLGLLPETTVAQIGISELGIVYQHAAHRAALAMMVAQKIKEAFNMMGPLSPEQEQWFAERAQAYLDELLAITDEAGLTMMGLLSDEG